MYLILVQDVHTTWDAAIYGARASYIGGVNGTATVSAGQMFGIPVGGTHAHSWVMEHSDELTAFRSYAKVFPNNCTLLVDTYDVFKVWRSECNQGISGDEGCRDPADTLWHSP